WEILRLFKTQGDISLLSESFEKLKKYLNYLIENRAAEDKMLFEWKIKISEVENRCEESRMDSSPRFDGISKIYALDFSCYMANEAKALSEIADILGKSGEHLYWSVIYDRIKDAVNRYLYDEEDGFYYDKCAATNKLIKVKTPASFLPLFVGFCDKKRADYIITNHLFNTDEFFTPFPLPSVSKDDEKFDGGMWHGAAHPFYSYFVSLALLDYGYKKEAQKIMYDTVLNIAKWYENDGVIYEFYDSKSFVSPSKLRRKGEPLFAYIPKIRRSNVRDFGVSSAVFAEMIMTLYRQ
ncbi:MAG: trehalase family glycosidase, partial [Clostridia bacterium]|nr:trehalase family glycosidase [Clostridia bacterium]